MKLFEIKNRFSGEILFSLECESFKVCVEIAVNKKADLRYADLRNADLGYADLRNADLRYANLRNADLRNADLRNANLRYADLRYADLRNADLRYADLRNADLRNADLRYADLDFSSGTPLWCGGLDIKKDRKQIIQDMYHAASNMKHYLSKNKDDNLQRIFEIAEKLQNEFHKIDEVGNL